MRFSISVELYASGFDADEYLRCARAVRTEIAPAHFVCMLRYRYKSVEAAIRQLNMEPVARMRKRSRAPEIDLSTD